MLGQWLRRSDDVCLVVGHAGSVTRCTGNSLATAATSKAELLGDGNGPVGILARSDVESVTSMVGCLLAGRPWLALPADMPDDYLLAGFAKAGASDVLCGADPARAQRLSRWLQEETSRVGVGKFGRAAYLVQTSGTTGDPSIVAVPGSALAHYVKAMTSVLGETCARPGARFGVVTTLTADLAFTTFMVGLFVGAEIHLVASEVVRDPERYRTYQETERLDVVKTTPGHVRSFLETESGMRALPRQVLIVGGEPFGEDLRTKLSGAPEGLRVLNHYGPAETCIGVAVGPVALHDSGPVPVGPPLGEASICVLDRDNRQCSQGDWGQIAISGPCVALGYVGDPGRTAAKFVELQDGARAYLTGDLGRLSESGALHVSGRIDRQRKVGGFRVEPEGVEEAIRRTGLVTDVYVSIERLGSLGESVVAWVSAADEVSLADLSSALEGRLLPAHHPRRLAHVPSIPRTTNGKVEYSSLPPISGKSCIETEHRTVDEVAHDRRMLQVLGALRKIVGDDNLGPDDDLMVAGLHSLAAVTATQQINERLGSQLGVSDIYRLRTAAAITDQAFPVSVGDLPRGQETLVRGFAPMEESLERLALVDSRAAISRIPLCWEFETPVAAQFLSARVDEVVGRNGTLNGGHHEALRLRIVDDVDPAQAVLELGQGAWNLAEEPAVRVMIIQDPDGLATHLTVVAHHARFDHASAEIFIREVLGGAPNPTGQRVLAPGLAPVPPLAPPMSLRLDSRGATGDDFLVRHQLPEDVWSAAVQVAAGWGTSAYVVALTAWHETLVAYGADRHLAVLGTVDLRTDYGFGPDAPVMGCFVNTVPVRIETGIDETWVTRVESVAAAVATALDHRTTPFDHVATRMLEEHGVPHPSRTMFGLQRGARLEGVAGVVSDVVLPLARPAADLDAVIHERPGGDAFLDLHVAAGTCTEAQAQWMVEHFVHVLRRIVQAPRVDTTCRPGLAGKHRSLLEEWGDGGPGTPRSDVLDPSAPVPASPGDTVHIQGSTSTTRAEFDALVERFRFALRQRLGAGDTVAFMLRHGPHLQALWLAACTERISILALSPSWPKDRVHAVLRRGGPSLLITAASDHLEGVPVETLDVEHLLSLGSLRAESASPPQGDEVAEGVADTDIAYLIATSGSTGEPGLVEVTRGGWRNHLGWMDTTFPLTREDRVLLHTSPAFDVVAWELAGPIVAGAVSVAVPPGLEGNVEGLAGYIVEHGVSVMQTVPTLLGALLEVPGFSQGCALRLIMCGGEAMSPDLAKRCARELPDTQLVNAYGPTEGTIDATFDAHARGREATTIGRPISGTRVAVVDHLGHLVPPGAPGELVISGAGLALGYRNDPTRTAGRFRSCPALLGSPAFFTGDIVAWGEDGLLRYLGRSDNQVKIRGQRIELEEIEARLLDIAGVGGAVALVSRNDGDHVITAKIVAAEGVTPGHLRRQLRRSLPDVMVPSSFERVARLPQLPSGKVDRRAAGDMPGTPMADPEHDHGTGSASVIAALWRDLLGYSVGPDEPFFAAGGNSIQVLRLRDELQKVFDRKIPVSDLFRYVTISDQAAKFGNLDDSPEVAPAGAEPLPSRERDNRVAIVGMASRAPGVSTPDDLLRRIVDGAVAISAHTTEELIAAGHDAAAIGLPNFVKASGVLDDALAVDHELLGLSAHEAALMSPQHRLLLDVAWQAMEDAGLLRTKERDVGVFVGSSEESHPSSLVTSDALEKLAVELGRNPDYLATRVSYQFDLTGPAMTVRTACSTSLTAVHLAVRSLLDGECRAALAGGVALRWPLRRGHVFEDGGIYSKDGFCRPYDDDASGIVSGDGGGIVVLKRLADAVADGDHIHAMILGSAINNDGAGKSGFTAPSFKGQVEVARASIERAGVAPETIRVVEGHGTGTPLGDPLEVAALSEVWCGVPSQSVSLGSIKATLGHLDAAAGVMGLISAVLAVREALLPGIPTLTTPHREIPFASSPFRVHRGAEPWPAQGFPRRASVHSLGLGGTNVHVVVEQAPAAPDDEQVSPEAETWVMPMSARGEAELHRLVGQVGSRPAADHRSMAAVFRTRRTEHPIRYAVVAGDEPGLQRGGDPARFRRADISGHGPTLMFSGGGTHRVGMGRHLYKAFATFSEAIDLLSVTTEQLLGVDMPSLLWGAARADLARPSHGFAAIVGYQLAASRLVEEFTGTPKAAIGNSLGELAAGAAAGVLRDVDALRLAHLRGSIFERLPDGGCMVVSAGAETVLPMLPSGVEIAVFNSEFDVVVSGSLSGLKHLEPVLAREGIDCTWVAVPGAVHSAHLDPFLEEYEHLAAQLDLGVPRIPLISNVSGTWMADDEAISPAYWARQLRSPVRLDAGLREVAHDAFLLDIGPGRALAGSARSVAKNREDVAVAAIQASGDGGGAEVEGVAKALAALWERGAPVQWDRWAPSRATSRAPVALPARTELPERSGTRSPSSARAQSRRSTLPVDAARMWRLAYRQWSDSGRAGTPPRAFLLGEGALRYRDALRKSGGDAVVTTLDELENVTFRAGDWIVDARLLERPSVAELLALVHTIGASPVNVALLLRGSARILGDDAVSEAAAAVAPLVATVNQERSPIKIVTVDVDEHPETPPAVARALEAPDRPARLAVRQGAIWEASLAEVRVDAGPPLVRADGCYIVTGGLGRFGRWLGLELARLGASTVVLLQRSALPTGTDTREARLRREGFEAIREAGATPVVWSCDVGVASEVRTAVDEIDRRFGPIRGVVHGAGDLVGESSLVMLDDLTDPVGVARGLAEQERSKVCGTQHLHEALAGHPLDWAVILSSNAGLLGGPGLSLYSWVNAWQSAFCQGLPGSPARWVAIGWDGWSLPEDDPEQGATSGLQDFRVPGEQVLGLIGRAVASGQPALWMSRGDLDHRWNTWVSTTDPHDHQTAGGTPSASATSAQPEGREVVTLASIWRDLLGDEPLPQDDFYAQGGSSLTMMRLRARVRDDLGVTAPIGQYIAARTFAEIERLLALAPQPTSIHVGAPTVGLESHNQEDIFTMLDEISAGPHLGRDKQ